MDFELDLDKIKDVPQFLAKKAFWVTLVLIGVAVLVGLLLGYKYNYQVKQAEPEGSTLIRLNQKQLEKVSNQLEERERAFNQITAPSYNLFEAD